MDGDIRVSGTDIVSQVIDFNALALKIDPRDKSLLSSRELEYAIRATHEEAAELAQAHQEQDFIGAVDAVLDQIYFQIGFLYRMGLTHEEITLCFSVVHQANMNKKLGTVEKRGGAGVADAVKPEGWVGPEEGIAQILGG